MTTAKNYVWKLKNKKTGKFTSRKYASRDDARMACWSLSGFGPTNNYTIEKVFIGRTATKTSSPKKGSTTFMANTKPILKKVKFGTPTHKAKPVHRSY